MMTTISRIAGQANAPIRAASAVMTAGIVSISAHLLGPQDVGDP
jgi:hypothetical protein